LPNFSKDIRTTPETQEGVIWGAPTGTLGELVAAAERRANQLAASAKVFEASALAAPPPPSLRLALRRDTVALITEIKRASPSKGSIKPGLDPVAQARAFESGGAAAISVLTEAERFSGSNDDLRAAAAASTLPILKKDFHVATVQLLEARALGASAALLIARALPPQRFSELVRIADGIGLEILAEVRSLAELDTALEAGCNIIGVNNRNLETLEVESGTADSIIPRIPPDCIAVAESGYSDISGITSAANSGADAVLIGSFLSAAEDVSSAVRRLAGIKRIPRDS
jgi:indole-3-glycerol phosphate synthase